MLVENTDQFQFFYIEYIWYFIVHVHVELMYMYVCHYVDFLVAVAWHTHGAKKMDFYACPPVKLELSCAIPKAFLSGPN